MFVWAGSGCIPDVVGDADVLGAAVGRLGEFPLRLESFDPGDRGLRMPSCPPRANPDIVLVRAVYRGLRVVVCQEVEDGPRCGAHLRVPFPTHLRGPPVAAPGGGGVISCDHMLVLTPLFPIPHDCPQCRLEGVWCEQKDGWGDLARRRGHWRWGVVDAVVGGWRSPVGLGCCCVNLWYALCVKRLNRAENYLNQITHNLNSDLGYVIWETEQNACTQKDS